MLYGTVYYIYGNIYVIICIYNGNRLKSISVIVIFCTLMISENFKEFMNSDNDQNICVEKVVVVMKGWNSDNEI